MPSPMIIAIDGPAGAGKSTASRLLAKTLGYAYLDTGAMYRSIAWALLEEGACLNDSLDAARLSRLSLHFALENGALIITHSGRQLDEELRRPEMARHASLVSQQEAVRAFLTEWQRRLGAQGSLVAEGRDMTTVVFPQAPIKVFLTADLPTRTRRRLAEYHQKGVSVDYPTLEAQIRERDEADQQRALAPLRPAPDALILDTSGMKIDEVVDRLLELVASMSQPQP